jgi:dTDP-4-dehydrorhamnose reductase
VDFVERPQVDLTRPKETQEIVAAARPDIVVNAAAYTAVDAAESNRVTAFAVNRDGPAALAEICRGLGAALVHFSTDYVYDGRKPEAYVETDPVAPLSVYGASKAEGDAAIAARLERHVILRTSWVYSASRLDCGKIARVYGIEAPPWQVSLSAVLDELIAAAVPTERG